MAIKYYTALIRSGFITLINSVGDIKCREFSSVLYFHGNIKFDVIIMKE